MLVIVLDAGHGGYDLGTSGHGLVEKDLALEITLKVKQQLSQHKGISVHLTRANDTFISLLERADIANRLKADYFVSFHHNSGGGTGFESYIFPGLKGTTTAHMQSVLHKKVMAFYEEFGLRDRGEKTADFAVLRETKMPAILLENLFLDATHDAQCLKQSHFINELSQTIAESIIKVI
ncbi:N-acetylmuramoyl-L-alanine amidase [Scopulibacillus daqui]|uniref:N-acetylmuramoyl-L-alanine amidase n=1 Tax=Scopulibacillus daqui TaxID=1469162 RepID=A0ABS2Q3Z2_9BACL|nr:N-acetylmuramoyl-L-alanine amidase [Scopulibacillus daqui]MBM7647024.1 N-acetylmuramoyl-L-alanine amidase [Scopulibacillus daqui]